MILWYNIAYIWMYCTTRCSFYGTYKLVKGKLEDNKKSI